MRVFFACADIVFADDRDIGLVLNRDLSGESAKNIGRVSADAAFTAFPQLARITATTSIVDRIGTENALPPPAFCVVYSAT